MSIVYDFDSIAAAMHRTEGKQGAPAEPSVSFPGAQSQAAVGVWNGPPPSMLNDMARQYMASQTQASSQLQNIGIRQQNNYQGLAGCKQWAANAPYQGLVS